MKSTAFLVLLLLFPPTASATEHEALTVQDVEVRAGSVAGNVEVLKLLPQEGQRPASAFWLGADTVRLEVDYSALVLQTVQRTYTDPTTHRSTHTAATVEGLTNRAEARWTLDAWPGHDAPTVEVQTACMEVKEPTRPVETTRAVVHDTDNRPDRVSDLSETVRPVQCPDAPAAEAVIRGNWRLSVWDWAFRLTDDAGTRVVETGLQPRSDGVGHEAREAFLFVTNGTLRLPLDDPSAFYVKPALVSGDEVDLRGAAGPLSIKGGVRVLDGEDVTLYGVDGLHVTGRGVGEDLGVTVPDIMSLSPATSAPASPLQAPPTLAVAVLMVLAVAAGVFVRYRPLFVAHRHQRGGADLGTRTPRTRRQWRGLGYRFLARTAHRARRHHRALHFARRAHSHFPEQPEVRLMLATSLNHLDRHAEALPHYVAAAGMTPDREPKVKAKAVLGIAVSNAALGELEAAVDAFERVADLDRDLATERLGAPSILALNEHPRFKAIRAHLERMRGIPAPERNAPKSPAGDGIEFS